jgi:putative transposase
MHFNPSEVYHIYNRGNHHQKLFFSDQNYIFFLKKIRNEWLKYGDILAYCLMPNHFHIMMAPNEEACKSIFIAGKDSSMQNLSRTIGKTLSSYSQAINRQNNSTGTLFQKKTKAKLLLEDSLFTTQEYLEACFHYIHENPLAAKLVKQKESWPYSSYPDYFGFRNGTLCNKQKWFSLTGYTEKDFIKPPDVDFDRQIFKVIF